MKTLTLIFCLLLPSAFTLAQNYAVTNDKGGFVNIRKEPNAKAGIIGKLFTDDIFSYDDLSNFQGDWIKIYYGNTKKPGGNVETGYIYKNRILPISSFVPIGHKVITGQKAIIKNDSIETSINTSPFIPGKHKLGSRLDAPNQINFHKIDGRYFWGTDGGLPKVGISSLKITIAGHPVSIPLNAYNDLYEPSLGTFKAYLGKNNAVYVRMDNSDGAGAYTVIWIIKNHKYLKRFIDNSEA